MAPHQHRCPGLSRSQQHLEQQQHQQQQQSSGSRYSHFLSSPCCCGGGGGATTPSFNRRQATTPTPPPLQSYSLDGMDGYGDCCFFYDDEYDNECEVPVLCKVHSQSHTCAAPGGSASTSTSTTAQLSHFNKRSGGGGGPSGSNSCGMGTAAAHGHSLIDNFEDSLSPTGDEDEVSTYKSRRVRKVKSCAVPVKH